MIAIKLIFYNTSSINTQEILCIQCIKSNPCLSQCNKYHKSAHINIVAASLLQIRVTSALFMLVFGRQKVNVLHNKPKKVIYTSMPTKSQRFTLKQGLKEA
jgi:hypothetical protein